MPLVVTRQLGESIILIMPDGTTVNVRLNKIIGQKRARLSITAPDDVEIRRGGKDE